MKHGTAFTPEGPLTLGDLVEIVRFQFPGAKIPDASPQHPRIVECRTPMAGDRRQVTLTVTDEVWLPPAEDSDDQPAAGDQAATD